MPSDHERQDGDWEFEIDDCPGHDWEYEDYSFDHEFGTEVIRYRICQKCGLMQDESEYDDEPED